MHIETCLIHGLAHDGRGVGRAADGRVLFVRGALPGQSVAAGIMKSKKNFAEAELVEIVQQAPGAIAAPCPHHAECGGCPLQTMPASEQLSWKESFVREALKRIGHVHVDAVARIIPSPMPWNYRNKLELSFYESTEGRIILGLRKAATHDIFDISDCLLLQCADLADFFRKKVNNANNQSPKSQKGENEFWRKLVIRRGMGNDGRERFLVALLTAPGTNAQRDLVAGMGRDLLSALPSVAGFAHVEETREGERTILSLGAQNLRVTVADLDFTLGQIGFFQINTGAASLLCQKAAECAALEGGEIIWDLYCGGGLLGLALLHNLRKKEVTPDKVAATRLYGIESNSHATTAAIAHSREFGFKNCRFITGEAHKLAPSLPRPDVVVADPPRGGMNPGAVAAILKARPKRLVLVSCNPATLARDANAIEKGYDLVRVWPVDLFPQTAHVESVALMLARS